jgi:hypothetical protein
MIERLVSPGSAPTCLAYSIAALCIAPGDTGVAAIATQERPGRTKNVLWRTGRIRRDAGNSNQSF